MVTDVTIPPGVKLEVSAASSISPGASKGILTGDNIGEVGCSFRLKHSLESGVSSVSGSESGRPLP